MTGVLGVLLLVLAVLSTLQAGRSAARAALDQTLKSEADASVSALREYFERAESVDLLLANDAAVRATTRPGLTGGAPSAVSAEAAQALAYLEELYPGRISEACLIDRTGREHARVVQGRIAPTEDLSSQEADNSFFAPTIALPRGRVYQAAPYISQDTGEWVVSNSTPLADPSGAVWGLVHFEVALDSFRTAALDGGSRHGLTAGIVDDQTGRVLLETGRPLDRDASGQAAPGRPAPAALRAVLRSRDDRSRAATVDGHRVAVARVPVGAANGNAWSVVVRAPAGAAGWSTSIGLAPVAIALAALLLLLFAGLSQRSSHKRLRTISLSDELTGLPNRRLLTDRLEQALVLADRRGTTCAVLLIDLDRFKEVNDTLGHHHGDVLLCEVATRLAQVVRTSDTVARLGGDEFAVLLPEVDGATGAGILARRCLAVLHEPFLIEGVTLSIAASIGLALAPQHGADGASVMHAADVAMYEAKECKSGIVSYDPDLDVHTPSRLALLGDLRRALQSDELVLHYQPKVDLDTGAVHSAEALVRWQHPERGLLPPSEFIAVAEGTGLILPLTLRTLELAIGQARLWYDAGTPVQVAVNLSPRCLLEVDLPAIVQELLQRHGLPPRQLRLEITESTVMSDPARALAILTALQESGVALSLDDFGTGYSSMSYLKRLPVDELKIDRSFVTSMLRADSDSVLVRSSIDLGHNLGLSVVAEGVEDGQTMAELHALGCDVVQGFHLARPMPPGALTEWLSERAGQGVGDPDADRTRTGADAMTGPLTEA